MRRRRGVIAVVGAALLAPACLHSPDPPPTAAPCLAETTPLFGRYEGLGLANGCRSDAQCVAGGCSSEVCAAEPAVTTCEVVPTPRRDLGCRRCGCFEGTCRWVH